jgi:ribosomal protein S18 acetylase RimI-like enzyme
MVTTISRSSPSSSTSPRTISGAVQLRHAKPSDYGRIIGRINVWWGGREMAPMLPKLFFIHFEGTSFIAEDDAEELRGFVCGFLSQTADDEAYIHFVGVDPEARGLGVGRALYERFFEEVRANGRSVVRCVTSPANERSVAFHESLGFEVERVVPDYDGPGEDRALLVKQLT